MTERPDSSRQHPGEFPFDSFPAGGRSSRPVFLGFSHLSGDYLLKRTVIRRREADQNRKMIIVRDTAKQYVESVNNTGNQQRKRIQREFLEGGIPPRLLKTSVTPLSEDTCR
jgi:hypothetical protein